MIQLIWLRHFLGKDGKRRGTDKLCQTKTEIPSVKFLFDNLDKILEEVPEGEHWNLFYTVANCDDAKREFESCSILPIDLDGIEDKYQDSYISVVSSALKIPAGHMGIVGSGHGLHFLINLQTPITSTAYYKANRHHYKAICAKINTALTAAGLPGKADTAVFDPRRILRVPKTVNRKPDKPDCLSFLIQPIPGAVPFNLAESSGAPSVKSDEQVNPAVLRRYPKVDSAAVMSGCNFLKMCRDNPATISEPQWYAALSITARLNDSSEKDGYDWSHELSKGHPGYSESETDLKIEQALEASGPRTCLSINGLWDGCTKCPHWQKTSSPLMIRGADAIQTELTGFYNIPWDGKGKPTPNFEDLRKYFAKENPYRGLDGSGLVHIWDGKQYQVMGNLFLEQYAQKKFDPPAKLNMVKEFRTLIQRTNLYPTDWWQSTVKRKINFQNGYLDIETMEFRPHDQEIGFRYVLPYNYDPAATAPTFSGMLARVTGDDADTQKIILEFMGYALSSDDCWAQKALVLVGEGANGKSTLINVLTELAGSGNYSSLNMDWLNKSEYNRQLLDGKLFNISEETPTKALLDNSLFKSLATGGEIQVRAPYKEPYFIRSMAKLIFTCNEIPGTPDTSFGFYRRLILIPFRQKFTKDSPGFDPHINKKLSAELPGIFNLAMEGYKRLVEAQGFTKSSVSEAQLAEYQRENDSVLDWAAEAVKVHSNGTYDSFFSALLDMYTTYKQDTESLGKRPVTFKKFCISLKKVIPDYETRLVRKQYTDGEGKEIRMRGLQGIDYQNYQ